MPDLIETFRQTRPHPIKSVLLDERIVGDETDDSVALAQTRFGPFEEANVSIVNFAKACGFRNFCVSGFD